MILNILFLKISFFIFTEICAISSIFELNLYFIFKNSLIFFINVVIVFISFLLINIITSFFFINIFIIIVIEFFVKYCHEVILKK